MRLIDADTFKEKFSGQYEFMKRVIDDEPTIDDRIHAMWKQDETDETMARCTNCRYQIGLWTHAEINYCPNCGAKMKLER